MRSPYTESSGRKTSIRLPKILKDHIDRIKKVATALLPESGLVLSPEKKWENDSADPQEFKFGHAKMARLLPKLKGPFQDKDTPKERPTEGCCICPRGG
jgi:hypothetical protein